MKQNVKRDNQKLSETLKLKTDENEQLAATIKNLEEMNKEYKQKLQELPQLQERINNLERKNKLPVTLLWFVFLTFSDSQAYNIST